VISRLNYLILEKIGAPMEINWRCVFFDALSVQELYAVILLRIEVFSIEQQCIYQDLDKKDYHCYHLMGFREDTLVAYARILPPGIAFSEASIGRVVTSREVRGKGAGRALLAKAIPTARELFGPGPLRIGAQLYLKKFYESFGFVTAGDIYLEDAIPHIGMILDNV
jgi:ElaA protein